MPEFMKDDRHERLLLAMRAAGLKTAADLVRVTGLPDSTARAYVNGGRGLSWDACVTIAPHLGVQPGWLYSGELAGDETSQDQPMPKRTAAAQPAKRGIPAIRIVGKVAAGVWHEVRYTDRPPQVAAVSALPPDPRFPISAQYDLIVEGSSLNRFAKDGQYLRCVDILKSGAEINDGDLVIVVRTKDSFLYETTAKRLRIRRGRYELWPDSDDPAWQEPIVIKALGDDMTDGEIRITALVLYAYTPAKKL
jgi:SOS-response transcriptional repressor LexA